MAPKPVSERIGMLEQRVEDGFKNIDRRFDEIGKQIKSFKWVTVPLIIILSSVLTALVYFFIGHVSGVKLASPETISGSGGTSSTTVVPGSTATATSHSDSATPSDSQTSTSGGGVTLTVPKVVN